MTQTPFYLLEIVYMTGGEEMHYNKLKYLRDVISRRYFLSIGGGAVLAGSPLRALASFDTILDDQTVLSTLDNSAWIPEGPSNASHIYVIAAPWCPYCHAVQQRTRLFSAQAQFRWIMTGGRDERSIKQNAALSYRRDAAQLTDLYNNRPINLDIPPNAEWGSIWNEGVDRVVSPAGMKSVVKPKPGDSAGTPFFLWLTKRGNRLSAWNGAWPDEKMIDTLLKWMVTDVVPRSTAVDIVPEATLVGAKIGKKVSIAPRMLYSAKDAPLVLYAAPDLQAPVVQTFGPGSGQQVGELLGTSDARKWARFTVNQYVQGWAQLELLHDDGGRAPTF